MAKLTDVRVATLRAHFNTGDQPSEANFSDLIQYIQEGIEEHNHDGTGDGDGTGTLWGPITMAGNAWIGIGAALERIVFDVGGDITVMGAKFGVNAAAPTTMFEVNDDFVGFAVRIFNDGNNDNRWGMAMQCGADLNTTARYINFGDGNGTTIGYVIGDGAGGITYHSASDERLKNILGPIDPARAMKALTKVDTIQYVGKGLTEKTGHKKVGFSAQAMLKHFPEVVNHDEETDMYSISYERLVSVLWAQNKELLKRIEVLEAK